MDDQLVAGLPLATLNTARQHHNRDEMADSPSGDIVAYGDVTRSIALAHARSDEATYRERRFENERFHDFVAELLDASGYKPIKRDKTRRLVRRLIGRAHPTDREIHTLLGVLRRATGQLEHRSELLAEYDEPDRW